MLRSAAHERARRRIVGLCHAGRDAPALLAGVAAAVQGVVGYDAGVWGTTDPDTLLITGSFVQELSRETAPLFYENEYLHDDVLKFSRLARGPKPVATLSEATAGDLDRARLHREVSRISGWMGDSLRAAFVAGGACWGVVALVRRDEGLPFSQADVSFMASVCGHVGEGLRAALLLDALAGPAAEPGLDEVPGLVVLDGDRMRAASPSAARWLDELAADFGRRAHERAPAALLSVAAAARRMGADDPPSSARAVVRTRAGRWLALHGMRLEAASGEPELAVIIEPARAPQLAPVLMSAYGLSARERDVAQQIISGATTAEACAALHISPYTLQDHLKSIFDRVGVRSRGELTLQLFDRHYGMTRLRSKRHERAFPGSVRSLPPDPSTPAAEGRTP
jgi:DNA-binding CsgD family transcriptional regulator